MVQPVSALDQQAVVTTSEPAAPPQPTSDDEDQDLFGFVKQNARTETVTRVHSIDQEIDAYLCSPDTSTSSLLQYPHLVPAFLKYNAALPSGSAVERLFSCAGHILVPRRCKLSNDMFEKLVFLRYKLKKLQWHTLGCLKMFEELLQCKLSRFEHC